MTLVRVKKDKKGIFIKVGGYISRPGNVRGFDHAFDMSDGGLVGGEQVKAHHVSQSPYNRIKLDNGKVLVWLHEDTFS